MGEHPGLSGLIVLPVILAARQRIEACQAQEAMSGRLLALQQQDFERVLHETLGKPNGAAFPLDRWLKLLPHLPERRYQFAKTEHKLLRRAEETWQRLGAAARDETARQQEEAVRQAAIQQQQAQEEANRRVQQAAIWKGKMLGGLEATIVPGLGGALIATIIGCCGGLEPNHRGVVVCIGLFVGAVIGFIVGWRIG